MRLIFFSAGTFGCPGLTALHRSSHTVQGVVTTPDKAQGRGQRVLPAPPKVLAQELGIPVLPITRVNDPASLRTLKGLAADVFVIESFGQILSEDFLHLPPQGCVNIHPSLLPKYRGASPIQEALMNGDKVVGTSTLCVSPELDAGDILLQDRLELGGDENAKEVWDALANLSAKLLVRTLDLLEKGGLKPVPQKSAEATYCSKLSKKHGVIDWSWDAERIHNLVRALILWPGTTTRMGDKNVKILKTRFDAALSNEGKEFGIVLEVKDPQGIRVAAGRASLWVEELQLEGKRPMRYDDFVHGHKIEPGFVFG